MPAKPATTVRTSDRKKAQPATTTVKTSNKRKADDDTTQAVLPPKTAKRSKPTEKPTKPNGIRLDNKKPLTPAASAPAKPHPKAPVAKAQVTKAPASKAVATKQTGKTQTTSSAAAKDNGRVKKPVAKTKPKAAAKPIAASKSAPGPKFPKIGPKINDAPTQPLEIYVFGEGSQGELGLGNRRFNGKSPIDVKRPRINHNLDVGAVGVVQLSCGGMHVAALTHDNKILTWGVNDQGALGRDTTVTPNVTNPDVKNPDDSDDLDDSVDLNPRECTPAAVSDIYFAPGAKFVQVVASDSATFALTEDGRVYGWGTFRANDGILGFTQDIKVQTRPMLLPSLTKIKSLAAGNNHVIALDHKGNLYAWGSGQQNELGRRVIERTKTSSLRPEGVYIRRGQIVKVACGAYHSFAIGQDGRVWSWGLNNFAETGIRENAGEDEAVIYVPTIVESLADHKIVDIAGGSHHSLAVDEDGVLLIWGRTDAGQVGVPKEQLTAENCMLDDREVPRILLTPSPLPLTDIVSVSAGTDNSFALNKHGQVYSWGFSENYQTGQGSTDDVTVPTIIDNSAIKGKHAIDVGAGGQYSIIACRPPIANGTPAN